MRPQIHPVFAWLDSVDDEGFEYDEVLTSQIGDIYDEFNGFDDEGLALSATCPAPPMKLQLRNGDLKDIHIPPPHTRSATLPDSTSQSESTGAASYVLPAKQADMGTALETLQEKRVPQPIRQPKMPGVKPGFSRALIPVKDAGQSQNPGQSNDKKGHGPKRMNNRHCGFVKKVRALDQQWR